MKRITSIAAALAAWMALAPALRAQDEAAPPAAEPEAAPEAPKQKPRPKPRPKPKAKPIEKSVEKSPGTSAETPAAGAAPEAVPKAVPEAVPKAANEGAAGAPAAVPPAANPVPPALPPAQPLTATPFAAPQVACDPGQAVHYQGGKQDQGSKQGARSAELWVTRSGAITIDNPLRPLTPDVTRVLQVVVAGKVATAYGPDLLSLRRGASPATLEGTIGGRIHWDASLVALPDTLPINAETGEPLAELRFLQCGAAPSAKTLPPPKARRMAPTPEAVAAEADKAAKAASKAAEKAVRSNTATPPPGVGQPPPRPPGLNLPQGAIP